MNLTNPKRIGVQSFEINASCVLHRFSSNDAELRHATRSASGLQMLRRQALVSGCDARALGALVRDIVAQTNNNPTVSLFESTFSDRKLPLHVLESCLTVQCARRYLPFVTAFPVSKRL